MSCDGKHVGWWEQDISTATSSFMRTLPSSQTLLTLVGCGWPWFCMGDQVIFTVLCWLTWVCNYLSQYMLKGKTKIGQTWGVPLLFREEFVFCGKIGWTTHTHTHWPSSKINWTLAIVCSISTWLSQILNLLHCQECHWVFSKDVAATVGLQLLTSHLCVFNTVIMVALN